MKTSQLQIRISPREKAMLQSRAQHLGLSLSRYVLTRLLPAEAPRYAELMDALKSGESERFALADLNELLASLPPADYASVLTPPPLGLSLRLQNQVAAMVEHAAVQLGVLAPGWCAAIPPLDAPWFASELESLRAHLLHASPTAFRRRNLFVDASVGDRV